MNKIGLPQQQYFIVQQIYRGWALFGVVLIAATVINFLLSAVLWRRGEDAWPAFLAGFLIAATVAIFFIWTYPANQATHNWMVAPPDWQTLRQHWELAHAASAILTFAALCFSTLAAMASRN